MWPFPMYDMELKQEATYSLMEQCLEADYGLDGDFILANKMPSCYLQGVYPATLKGFIALPLAIGTDTMYNVPLKE